MTAPRTDPQSTVPVEPRTDAGLFLRNGLEAMGLEEADANERIVAIEEEAAARASQPIAATLDAAYRERNAVVAALIRSNGWPAEVVMAPDTEGWWIVYADTPSGQVSWHISPDDMDLFSDWPVAFGSHKSPWDGHSTEEKYARLAALTDGADHGAASVANDLHAEAPRVMDIRDPFTGETHDGPSYDAGFRDGIEHQRSLFPVREDEPTGIDVERLATATHVIRNHAAPDNRGDRFPHPHPLALSLVNEVKAIAAEYDRLTREASHVR